ncbi:MAG: hypothetical protein KJZ64_02635 [Sphingomonadaceae bacterium]|nr:hypothetical protein [Sphingomonadaceae bacterium]
MASRGSIIIGEVEYDCSHLDPFMVELRPHSEGTRGYRVLVSFSCHTFTREAKEDDPPEFIYEEGGEVRCFCQDRYLASKGLKAMIHYHCNGRAYFSEKRNFMLIEQPLGGPPYAVFFNVERAKLKSADAVMFVASAYEKPNLPAKSRLPSITFRTLIHKTVRGEKISKPKK